MKQLQQEKRWVLWRREMRKGDFTKVPYKPNGREAKSNDPSTWIFFKDARQYERDFDGIGFFLSPGLCGIDVDGDHKEGGTQNPLEADVRQLFAGTYQEKSPSGTGVHIVFRADMNRLPLDGKGKLDPRYYVKNENNGLECYIGGATNRYLTYTGNRISAGEEVTDQTDALLVFLDKYMVKANFQKGRKKAAKKPTAAEDFGAGDVGPIDVKARLDMARNAANGEKFRRLYDMGDVSEYNNDDSSADEGLCAMLAFWLNCDPALMDEAFRASALYRDKWEREDYRASTIAKAVDMVSNDGGPYREKRFKYRPANSNDLTDAGNALVFSNMCRDRLRWCDALGWLVWNGKVWEQNDHLAEGIAQTFSNDMLHEAEINVSNSTITKPEGGVLVEAGAKAYLKHAQRTRSSTGISSMLELSKAWLYIAAAELDADPYLLNTKAGIVDLHTGELGPHDPTAFCTKLAPCVPSNEGAEMWETSLDMITEGDVELKNYLRLVCGMSIIGAVKDEGVQIAFGSGRNGKSTFFNALFKVLGEYAGTIDPNVLIASKQDKKVDYATLRGKRFVMCAELEEGQRLSTGALKAIATKNPITVKQLYRNPETLLPSHHIYLYTNYLPHVGANDDGTWRRLTVIPFDATMPEGDADIKDYENILADQAGGAILQWLISGAVDYLANNCHIAVPDCVQEAINKYRAEEDWMAAFIDDCCIFDPTAQTPANELYKRYKQYALEKGETYIRSDRDFRSGLVRQKNLTNVERKHRSIWIGIKIAEKSDE